jgi:hypothetical protein
MLVVDPSGWPLLTGGRCSEVIVGTGLTVFLQKNLSIKNDKISYLNKKLLTQSKNSKY